MKNILVAIVVAKCFSLAEVRGQVCWALCRNDGYETGSYLAKSESCLCGHVVKFKELTEPRIIIRSKPPILPDAPSANPPFVIKFGHSDDDD